MKSAVPVLCFIFTCWTGKIVCSVKFETVLVFFTLSFTARIYMEICVTSVFAGLLIKCESVSLEFCDYF